MNKQEILIGKSMEEAIELLRNCNYRIVENDDRAYGITDDVKTERFNLYINNNLITKITFK